MFTGETPLLSLGHCLEAPAFPGSPEYEKMTDSMLCVLRPGSALLACSRIILF